MCPFSGRELRGRRDPSSVNRHQRQHDAAGCIQCRHDRPVLAPTPAPARRRVAQRDRLTASDAKLLQLAVCKEAHPLAVRREERCIRSGGAGQRSRVQLIEAARREALDAGTVRRDEHDALAVWVKDERGADGCGTGHEIGAQVERHAVRRAQGGSGAHPHGTMPGRRSSPQPSPRRWPHSATGAGDAAPEAGSSLRLESPCGFRQPIATRRGHRPCSASARPEPSRDTAPRRGPAGEGPVAGTTRSVAADLAGSPR